MDNNETEIIVVQAECALSVVKERTCSSPSRHVKRQIKSNMLSNYRKKVLEIYACISFLWKSVSFNHNKSRRTNFLCTLGQKKPAVYSDDTLKLAVGEQLPVSTSSRKGVISVIIWTHFLSTFWTHFQCFRSFLLCFRAHRLLSEMSDWLNAELCSPASG